MNKSPSLQFILAELRKELPMNPEMEAYLKAIEEEDPISSSMDAVLEYFVPRIEHWSLIDWYHPMALTFIGILMEKQPEATVRCVRVMLETHGVESLDEKKQYIRRIAGGD